MKHRKFGATGVSVPVIGQGTWNLERAERERAVAALKRGLDAGMAHIDTAEMYGSGAVEEMVAQAVAGRRQLVFLATKVLPGNASRAGTIQACEQSLRRLRTDWIDLYLLHWPGALPLEETLGAFDELQRRGLIRAFGVSNFDAGELERAVAIAGEGRIACNQVLYHLEERAIEHDVIPFCKRHRIAVVGYSPFGSGNFPSPSTQGGRVLQEIARAHRATPRQVALQFLTRDENLFAIPMTSRPEHAVQNAQASELELAPEEKKRIDAAFARGPRRTGVPTL
jgi:diketogulonate reductase-like aldo/keto reductase